MDHRTACILALFLSFTAAARVKRITDARSDSSLGTNPKWNSTNVDKLKRDLMLNYDKFSRPGSEDNATLVKFDPTIHHVELDEELSILSLHCWIKMGWTDEKLKWDEKDYGGINVLHLADHEIWQPDVVPYNSASGSSIDIYGNTHAIVHANGEVIWVPPAILRVFCELDLRKWPFDTQLCSLKVGSWTYSGKEINLNFSIATPEFDNYIKNAEWKFESIKQYRSVTYYACCVEPYVDLVFNLTISRQSPTYRTIIVTPITAIVFMTLATFWLPAGSSDKLTIAGTTALIISLFLLYFTQKISAMAGHTPYIVAFYSSSLYLVAFSVVISVLVMNLASSRRAAPIPWIIKSCLTGWFGRILLLDITNDQGHALHTSRKVGDLSGDNEPVIDSGEGSSNVKNYDHEWRLLATGIDRIMFLFYCLLFICFALAYLT